MSKGDLTAVSDVNISEEEDFNRAIQGQITVFPGGGFIFPESLGRCMESTDGIHEWVEQATAYDRVRSISSTVSQPRSVQHIADEACVCEVTAREYLDRLSDLNVLLKSEQDGTPVYSPDPLHTRMKALRDLLENHTHEELLQLKTELRSQLNDEDISGRESELMEYRLSLVTDAIDYYSQNKSP